MDWWGKGLLRRERGIVMRGGGWKESTELLSCTRQSSDFYDGRVRSDYLVRRQLSCVRSSGLVVCSFVPRRDGARMGCSALL